MTPFLIIIITTNIVVSGHILTIQMCVCVSEGGLRQIGDCEVRAPSLRVWHGFAPILAVSAQASQQTINAPLGAFVQQQLPASKNNSLRCFGVDAGPQLPR